MEQAFLRAFEAQCVQEEAPACQSSCPVHVEARSFILLLQQGKIAQARKQLDRTLPLSCLMGYLCEGPCQEACVRAQMDEAVNLPLLEKACVAASQSAKPMPLPASGKHIAVLGAGLSSLVVAWELGKKGHSVTIFHHGLFGGCLNDLPHELLPPTSLPEALAQLQAVRVDFMPMDKVGPQWIENTLQNFLALYVGQDDISSFPHADAAALGLSLHEGRLSDNAITLVTEHPSVFAGGWAREGQALFMQQAADGKRAAASIDRLIQGVAPESARDKEGPYVSRLCVNTADIPAQMLQPRVQALDPLKPGPEEAEAEAARCIQCQCLECVKQCPYLAHYKGYPKRYVREIYNNLSVVQGLRQANTMINSCAQCGLCAVICPQSLDMGAFCRKARQEMVDSQRMPASAHEFALEDMAFSNGQDVALFRNQSGHGSGHGPGHGSGHERSAFVLFPGCQLPATLPEQSLALYQHLQQHLTGGVGLWLGCCGAPARWAGQDNLTAASVAAFRNTWEQAGKPEIVLACASCSAFFAAECPDIPCRSLWEVLADLPLPPKAAPVPDLALAIHDPCAARHDISTQSSVRALLTQLGQDCHELAMGQEHTRCCGYGGLASEANPTLALSYASSRLHDTDKDLLVYCAMCRERMQMVGKPSLHLLDLLFPGPDMQNPQQALSRPALGISERQEGRLRFRRKALKECWGENSPPPALGLRVNISPEVAQTLEHRRILHSDIQAVLREVQRNGALFCHPVSKRALAALRPRKVTFWLEFTAETDGSYTVHDAYCHRMIVPHTPSGSE